MVVVRKEGLYCVPGDFYIDPWRPVARAVITHAHGDHARVGHGHYLAASPGIGVLKSRLGDISVDALAYGEKVVHNGVTISLHPAGHVLGSSQVRMECGGEVWVASGDYKVEPDKTCDPFEPVRCDTFITESTFGLPIYRWQPEAELMAEINAWWRKNAEEGRCSVVFAYSFGKAHPGRARSVDWPDCLPRLGRAIEPRLPRRGCRHSADGAGDRYRKSGAAPRAGGGAAVRQRLALDEALRRLQRFLRQRLDAAARRAAPARRRPRLRAVRPRRLARPDERHQGHRG